MAIPTTPHGAATTTPTRWLNDIEMAAWLGFVQTQGDLLTALEHDLQPTGLTLGDYQVFVYLSASDDNSMKMCDLAELLQLSPSGLTRRLDGLVKSGWVERRPSEQDRRVQHAVLTSAGRVKLETAAPVHLESVRSRMIDLLDRDDMVALARAFGKIRAALDADRAAKIAS
jgi:DNA-binding MarR family transcriptional regulator